MIIKNIILYADDKEGYTEDDFSEAVIHTVQKVIFIYYTRLLVCE